MKNYKIIIKNNGFYLGKIAMTDLFIENLSTIYFDFGTCNYTLDVLSIDTKELIIYVRETTV